MSFYDSLKKVLDQKEQRTENGAVGYETSGSALVDMNFKVPSYRNASVQTILNDFLKAYSEDPELAVKWMFYAGDIREGLGERRLFKILVTNVIPMFPHLIPQIAEYSRFDVLEELLGTSAEKAMFDYANAVLTSDLANMKAGKSVTLLGKWLPSINTSSNEKRAHAAQFAKAFGMKPAEYRKTLSALRKHIGVIEVKMCSKEWSDIDYQKVPSKANLKYNDAFLRNDETRRREFLGALSKGEVKVNSGACFPHDIVAKYHSVRAEDALLEGMWKNLPARDASKKPVIVVRDGSGSMSSRVDNKSQVTALDVATALAIYFAEHAHADFKDQFITFSEHPKLISLKNLTTLKDKLIRAYREAECANTNIEAVFDLLLTTAKQAGMRQEDIPEVLIISDMEFDSCVETNANRGWSPNICQKEPNLFKAIGAKWKAAGYDLPGVTFWNVASRTNTVPMQQNKLGVKLLSGFSQNAIEMVMGDEKTPFDALKKVLLGDRYAPITLK